MISFFIIFFRSSLTITFGVAIICIAPVFGAISYVLFWQVNWDDYDVIPFEGGFNFEETENIERLL